MLFLNLLFVQDYQYFHEDFIIKTKEANQLFSFFL